MDIIDHELLLQAMRDYINERPCFNKSKIAEAIDYDRNNFAQWLNEKRSLPNIRVSMLENLLKEYGFMI